MQNSDGIKCIPVGRFKPRRKSIKAMSKDTLELLAGMTAIVLVGCLAGAGFGVGLAIITAVL